MGDIARSLAERYKKYGLSTDVEEGEYCPGGSLDETLPEDYVPGCHYGSQDDEGYTGSLNGTVIGTYDEDVEHMNEDFDAEQYGYAESQVEQRHVHFDQSYQPIRIPNGHYGMNGYQIYGGMNELLASPLIVVEKTDKRRRDGVGDLVEALRNPEKKITDDQMEQEQKQRRVLNSSGQLIRNVDLPVCRIVEVVQRVAFGDGQEPCDLPLHRLIQLMSTLSENKHPKDYEIFIAEQEAEMEQQRAEEMEANRIEELTSGGFIPPAEDIAAETFEVEVEGIPLPGENNGGIVPTFDSFGGLRQIRRPYKKKISPQCPFCDKRYRNEFSLKKHFIKKHPEYIDFKQCIRCFKCLRDDTELRDHECELTYVCFECNPIRNLISDIRLLNHRKKFHRGANSGFRCNQCNLKFLTPRKLRKHKKMAHVFTKTFQCHFCEEIFISEISVMTHERVHTGIIKFECKICDFKCNRFIQMEEHAKEEHGYICAICQEKFAEWAEIKNHTLQEHGGYLTSDSNSGYIESPRVWVMFKGE
ncbi:unnamed protein product, partial [Mesorhabditis belari]|uniref:C2H2-type domain-containing protein n=1 Tax=Mesorhabditis belari TaxID=2138241 RepID=A0AAF3FPV7_9BILA